MNKICTNQLALNEDSEKQNTYLSKLFSYLLRHKPNEYEIVLDENGYTNVDELINKLIAHKRKHLLRYIKYIVDINKK